MTYEDGYPKPDYNDALKPIQPKGTVAGEKPSYDYYREYLIKSGHSPESADALIEGILGEKTKVTRFEVIDDSGRAMVKYGVNIELSLQDDGRTLKVFLATLTKEITP